MADMREIRHFHLFGAIGGGARGFNRGKARVGNMVARFRCIGSIDVDAAANRDFHHLVGVSATTLDLFDGQSDQAWRERIGNAVPPDAAEAIASVMGTTLLLAWSGETFTLSSMPVWVQPVAMALSVAQGEQT